MEKRKKIILFIFLFAIFFLVSYDFSNKITGKMVLERDLTAYWNFDKSSGIVEYDLSGHGSHAYLEKGAHTIKYNNKRGKVLLLDGVDDYARVHDKGTLDLTNRFTIAAWVFSDNDDSAGTIFSKEGLGLDTIKAYNLYVGKNLFGYGLARDASLEIAGISLGRWHHVAVTYDAFSEPNMKMYIDGELVNSGNIDAPNRNRRELLIGRRGYAGKEYGLAYFKGMLDELRIYNRALSESEIKRLVNTYQ